MIKTEPLWNHLGYQLRRTDILLIGRIAEALSPLGLTPARATAVAHVAACAGCDQMALGRALGIGRATSMKVVNDLVALGIVERRPGRDRRSNALHLTPSGVKLHQQVEEIATQTDAENFSVLSDDERATLRDILAKLRTFVSAGAAEQSIRISELG